MPFDTIEELRKVQVADERREGSVDQSETDLAGRARPSPAQLFARIISSVPF